MVLRDVFDELVARNDYKRIAAKSKLAIVCVISLLLLIVSLDSISTVSLDEKASISQPY